jgi:hypothetical protein
MNFNRSLPSIIGGVVCASALFISGNAAAELIVGLTNQNALISFDSATPGTIMPPVSITGVVGGDVILGIDRRPSLGANNGVIYGFGVDTSTGVGRLYRIDASTGVATLAASLAADPADTTAPFPFTTVTGTSFGVDFNPTVDRLRVTSNTGQNLRINVDNGLVQLDVPLAYQAGDPNFGDAAVDVAVAYSNNVGGATTTVLRGVDIGQSPDALVIHTNPNGGVLQTTSTLLPFDSSELIGYDISGLTGMPYFSVTPPGAGFSQLWTIGSGGGTLIGNIGGQVALRDIAAPVGARVPEPGTLALFGIAAALFGITRRRH